MKLIKFRRLYQEKDGTWNCNKFRDILGNVVPDGFKVYQIAFDEQHLWQKLNGEMAEIIMPAKPWYVQLYRKFFPLKFTEIKTC